MVYPMIYSMPDASDFTFSFSETYMVAEPEIFAFHVLFGKGPIADLFAFAPTRQGLQPILGDNGDKTDTHLHVDGPVRMA